MQCKANGIQLPRSNVENLNMRENTPVVVNLDCQFYRTSLQGMPVRVFLEEFE